MFFWRLQLILFRTNKEMSSNQPSRRIFICYAFKACKQKKIERNCLAWISIISFKNEIAVVPSILLIFNFLAFIKETQNRVASSFIFFLE